jgi:hypothetical protein
MIYLLRRFFWRRTRIAAFCLVVVFHFLNAQFFTIGIFPWLAITATALSSLQAGRAGLFPFSVQWRPPN